MLMCNLVDCNLLVVGIREGQVELIVVVVDSAAEVSLFVNNFFGCELEVWLTVGK